MKLKLSFIFLLIGQIVFAQQKLPIIKATSKRVDVRDGGILTKAEWNISPQINPDIYTTSNKNTKVTFYTNLDSISFLVKPGIKYSFIILLNNKDTALTQIMYEPSKLDILKKAAQYNFNDKREINKYVYRSMNDTDLVALKKRFNLDSIAGSQDEILKILNIMHWIHNSIPADGTKEIPNFKSISDLINICTKEHKTLICGAFTWVLSDCYAAIGIKSKQVVCLPKDSSDNDCHSINAVYASTLKKWIWIDAMNNAYILNEKGEFLSIEEVRERLINDKPLILNPDANFNNTPVTKDFYLKYYMAKNLYAIECFAINGSSRSNLLLPVEFKGIFAQTKMNKPKCTNNPNDFWVKPE